MVEHKEDRIMEPWKLKMLYDGQCPFCRREVAWLEKLNHWGDLVFEDISHPDFDPTKYGLTYEEVDGKLHGITPEGTIVRGVETIRKAYQAVGLGWLVAPTGWPVLRPLFDQIYDVFAKYRVPLGQWLGGRTCEGDACNVHHYPSASYEKNG
jgi:predicted DCC family thiol-disulfide oxidoreductase YuxK